MRIKRGLLIKDFWLEKILSRKKVWEIRGSATTVCEKIALIKSGTGKIFGTCELVGVKGPLTLKEFRRNRLKTGLSKNDKVDELPYDKTYAWVLSRKSIKKLKTPVRYMHPQGAVKWVKLSKTVSNKLSFMD
ncbi:MAG TPA: hypothetical protein VLX29_08845 [Nitrospirota bacterium]|nr:hypothetical protein [Nitrospirota bacterium]